MTMQWSQQCCSSFQGHEPEEQTRLAKRAIELLFHGIQVQKFEG